MRRIDKLFKDRYFDRKIIILCVRGYLPTIAGIEFMHRSR